MHRDLTDSCPSCRVTGTGGSVCNDCFVLDKCDICQRHLSPNFFSSICARRCKACVSNLKIYEGTFIYFKSHIFYSFACCCKSPFIYRGVNLIYLWNYLFTILFYIFINIFCLQRIYYCCRLALDDEQHDWSNMFLRRKNDIVWDFVL